MPAEDMTITAKWTKDYYGVTFNAAEHSSLTKRTVSQSGKYAYNDEVEVLLTVDE
jgi:hypothetical protein